MGFAAQPKMENEILCLVTLNCKNRLRGYNTHWVAITHQPRKTSQNPLGYTHPLRSVLLSLVVVLCRPIHNP